MISPALERYTRDIVRGDLWKRPDLSLRDRSIVTLAALISRNQTVELASYLKLALDSGVKPREISEIITHLAFYSGEGNPMSAAAVTKEVFARRHIGADELPKASPELLPLNEAAEAERRTRVEQQSAPSPPARGALHSSRGHARRGTPTRPARRSSSRPVAAGSSEKAARSRRSGPAMSSGSLPA